MNTYQPVNFTLDELVDPYIVRERGSRAWELLQAPALITLDQLRDKFGGIVVNGTHQGHYYIESGLRKWGTQTGAPWSMHKFGGAFDLKFKRTTPREVSAYILAHPYEFRYITALENVEMTITWLHFDVRNHNRQGIWVVNPT